MQYGTGRGSGGTRVLVAPIRPAGSGSYRQDQLRLPLVLMCVAICALPLLQPSLGENLAPVDVTIIVAILGVLLWAGTTRQRLALPFGLGVGLIAMAGLVASLAGNYPALGLLSVMQDLYLLIWAAAIANLIRRPGALGVLTKTWALSSVVWAVAFILATTGETVSAGSDAVRAAFVFGEQNGAGLYFVLSLFVVLASRQPRRRWLRAMAVVLLVLATLYTGSLGALSGLMLGLALTIVLSVMCRRGPVPAVAVAAALVMTLGSLTLLAERDSVVAAANASTNSLVRNSIGRGDQSSSERQVLSQETVPLWRDSALVGLGPAATKSVLQTDQAPYPKEAHDDWVASLIERGILGILGLLLLIAEIVMRASRVWDPGRLLVGLRVVLPSPAYLVGGLVTVLVFSFTHEVLHDRTAWTLFGLVAAVSLWGFGQRPAPGGSV